MPAKIQNYLQMKQARVHEDVKNHTLDIAVSWNQARQTKSIRDLLVVLKEMAGARERCMYCVDSHGCDIDHFRPKAHFPEVAFEWSNLLLCCSECGRLKGSQFPLENGLPQLIDPCIENPWEHLDFDPQTGCITARFNVHDNRWSNKGVKTVEILQLDKREALSNGYKLTLKRLSRIISDAVQGGRITVAELLAHLFEEDDHGLLGWCFGAGASVFPFSKMRDEFPHEWNECKLHVDHLN
ncbi:MAG TPA: hypothetical protein VG962_01025 [Steroidobacteraceae bacterium]|nr:hypothetical protein [Steroidobacteraceae bacterium]